MLLEKNIEIVFWKGYSFFLLIGFINMRTLRVVTLMSLLISLATMRPGKQFLVETENNGNDVARFNARFNAPNVEADEGKVQVRRVSAHRVTLTSLGSEMSSSSRMSSSLHCNEVEHYISRIKNEF